MLKASSSTGRGNLAFGDLERGLPVTEVIADLFFSGERGTMGAVVLGRRAAAADAATAAEDAAEIAAVAEAEAEAAADAAALAERAAETAKFTADFTSFSLTVAEQMTGGFQESECRAFQMKKDERRAVRHILRIM